MNIEQQVPSLELCKRLKELGVKQDGVFGWATRTGKIHKLYFDPHTRDINRNSVISAPTVAELGEMLPPKQPYFPIKFADKWGTIMADFQVISGDNEAEARAKVVIFLLENNLLKNDNL